MSRRPRRVRITSDPAVVKAADRVVFPGQGAMPDCMRYLRESGLEDAVRAAAASKPLLAVCIGEQMLFERSEEGDTAGLGLFPGDGRPLSRRGDASGGWRRASRCRTWAGTECARRSRTRCGMAWLTTAGSISCTATTWCPHDDALSAGISDYGGTFTCAVARDNIFATQFHPEKSAAAGLRIYENFSRWAP